MARVQSPVPVDPGSETPRSTRLLATAFYDVWLVSWPDRTVLEPHDHGGVRSVLHVVDGELTEFFCDRATRQDPVVRTLRRGVSTTAEPSVVHALSNRSGRGATTLHVYSPPLVDVTSSDLHHADHLHPSRPRPGGGDGPRRAGAGAAPVALVGSGAGVATGPPRLFLVGP
ncbi:MAG: cysteine dioxygenase family protein [Acidimicrobiales bacterium]|jgi:hypothetical protein